jgi:hypothetical protein
MPLPLLALAAPSIASFLGGLFANKHKQTSTTTPTTAPAYQGLEGLILKSIQQRLASPTGLPAGYEAGGIKNINNTYDLINQARENNLTARGLAGSPVAAAGDTRASTARAGDIVNFQSTLPLVQRQLQNEDLGLAGNVLSLGRGTTSTGEASGGGGLAGGFTNLAQLLGFLYGKGAFGPGAAGGGGFPSMGAG